jgi:hypothetical protein
MTNRPTDDFENADRDTAFDYSDDDAAAFGDRAKTTEPVTDTADDTIAEQYDDSDFVADDAADVLDENTTDEVEYTEDAEYDPLAEEGDPYPTADEIYEPEDEQKKKSGGLMDKFNTMKTSDKVFYGLFGVGGLGALYFVFTMTMGAPPPAAEPSILTAPVVAEANVQQPANPVMDSAVSAPIENPAEPQPDVIGVQGGQSTLNNADTLAPLPPTVPDAPPAVEAPPETPVAEQAPLPVMPVIEQAPAPAIESAAPSAEQTQLQTQLAAQQQAMQQLQAQLQQQNEAMRQLQAQREAEAKSQQLTSVTTPPPLVQSDNPALNQLATDMGVRLAELNARITQLSESLNRVQEATTKLDQQNADLQNKAKDLSEKVGTQSTKITELANKEPPAPPVDKATVDKIKASVAQVERKLSAIAAAPAPVARAPSATVSSPAPSAPVAATRQTPTATPAPAQRAQPQQPSYVAPTRMVEETPRSPKSRDLQGFNEAPAKPTWVLRAATPSMAWLSPRPGSADLKRVAPGDAVDGIGQVLEIKQEMGRWVVVGTTGTIR